MKSKIQTIVASLTLATAFSMPSVQAFAAPTKSGLVKVVKVKKAKNLKFKSAGKVAMGAKSKALAKKSGKPSRKARVQARKKV